MRRISLGVVLALLVSGFARAQETPAPARAVLTDLAWLSGNWVDESEGGLSEETWTEPFGDSMLGMWRYVTGGKARVFELLAITAGPEGVVLRLRHFDPQMIAREDKNAPVTLKLVAWMRGEARFEGPAVGAPGQIAIHYRQKTDDTLSCTLEKEGKSQEFSFRRAK